MRKNNSTIRPSWFFLTLLFTLAPMTTVAAADAKRPNVLLFLADDQRPDCVGALDHPVLKTPAMDSLARRGMVFRNAFCFGSNVGAVCLPSRNMLLSGRAYFRWEGQHYAPPDKPNFPVTLQQAGYVCYHHGKKGNTAEPIQAKFDVNKYLTNDIDREGGEPGLTIVSDAIAFLREQKARGDQRPFFMYLAPPNPHDPRIAAPKYMNLYQRDQIPIPPNYMPIHPFDNGEMTVRDEKLAPWPRTRNEIRRHLHDYYASISGLDYHFGRLLEALDEFGMTDDTIVIFASDNGLAIGSHGLMGKQNLYEHSAKVPLIIAGPGIPKDSTDALVYLMDLFPTTCDLVNIPVPLGLDGKSLKSVIDGKSKGVRNTLFSAYRDVQRAVRDARWKLIRYPEIDKTQLFDLQSDPDELKDLSGDPAQADRIKRMTGELANLQKQYGDTAPLTVSDPKDPTFTPPADKESSSPARGG
ncbi:MAG TPA: sulfatase-like hydrolase/transferase [Phycisphaerae bacterium]|nr:sulfatase-like hydrolase/transferase [Phycisphaerae bacterium]